MVDLSAVNAQTRSLLRGAVGFAFLLGLWLIWDDVLPALGFLQNVDLWTFSSGVSPDGKPFAETLTLAELVVALFIFAVTTVAAKNLPGLLEITLQQFPLDSGGRYALATCARYLITVIGVVIGFNIMGIAWSNVQWLVAAMTVGLGFGLQEIFANFVSGLILLWERPMRVGDIITIGDISGWVSKMQMRATTITTWERKEMVVPNKEFIVGSFVNWTLSSRVLRLDVKVGIAYGSDTDLAETILREACTEHPNVLEDPAPGIIFDEFGDNSLNFVVRLYLKNVDDLITTRHQMHSIIYKRFGEAGIEIAFPQRDIHIRSVDAPLHWAPEEIEH